MTSSVQGPWRRHVIADSRSWRATFVFAADIDGDGRIDLVSGNSWYRNPGRISGRWSAHSLGTNVNNVAAVLDIDRDGDPDVFASTWNNPRQWSLTERLLRKLRLRTYYQHGGLIWAENTGGGNFIARQNVPSGHGDFLQGVGVIDDSPQRQIILSWHHPDSGLDLVSIPTDPVTETWPVHHLAVLSQDEDLSVADLDGDGDQDVVQGTLWLRNDGLSRWTQLTGFETAEKPDRNRLADINGDGDLDIVIGYEAVSRPGRLAWYQRDPEGESPWQEHVVATLTGPMSLDTADMDGDGDTDIVAGEHDLAAPRMARLLWFENMTGDGLHWKAHVIYVGDEHHDGAQVVDIDGDGDKDVVSIGWGHDRLILYENTSW